MKSLLFAVVIMTFWWSEGAAAQPYPSRPVRYLVPFPAGGSPDMVARILSERLNKLWGQPVVVENRSGAGGTVAAAVAAKATPDGYALFQCNIASNAIAYSLIDAAPTSPEAFAAFIRAETDRWAKVVKDAGITQQ